MIKFCIVCVDQANVEEGFSKYLLLMQLFSMWGTLGSTTAFHNHFPKMHRSCCECVDQGCKYLPQIQQQHFLCRSNLYAVMSKTCIVPSFIVQKKWTKRMLEMRLKICAKFISDVNCLCFTATSSTVLSHSSSALLWCQLFLIHSNLKQDSFQKCLVHLSLLTVCWPN